jgi:glycosyltransferase involved in cell wall biosynthesis
LSPQDSAADTNGRMNRLAGDLVHPYATVVIPLRDEEPTLEPLYHAIRDTLDAQGLRFELIFVDDGSVDGSIDRLTKLVQSDDRVRALRLRRNFGKAAALACGFREARGRVVVTLDADLQDDPAEIPRLIAKLQEGFDLVSGWKQGRRDSLRRRLASKLFNWATRRLSKVTLHDFNCGLKAYTHQCAMEMADRCYGELHRFLPVFAYWRGYRVAEVPVVHRERVNGRSRYRMERYVRTFLDFLTVIFLSRYRRRAMHLLGGIGLILFLGGFASLGYLVVVKLVQGASIGGRPLLTLGAVLCIGGLQLILAGLLSEMISSSHAEQVPYEPIVVVPDSGEWAGDGKVQLPQSVGDLHTDA